jgi:hypothetical protein
MKQTEEQEAFAWLEETFTGVEERGMKDNVCS